MAMSRLINDLRAKENEIIYESGNERGAIRIRVQNKSNQQKRSKNPGKPFDFDGQNKKDVDDLVGIKSCKCEEQRCDQHPVRKFRSEEECGDGCANHSDKKIKRQLERAPRSFEALANKPEKPEGQNDPERLKGAGRAYAAWNENVRDQPPDFPVVNTHGIEIEK